MLKIDNTLHCIIHGVLMEPSSFLRFAETERRSRCDISVALFKGVVVQNFGYGGGTTFTKLASVLFITGERFNTFRPVLPI